jgi:hypothetical protein
VQITFSLCNSLGLRRKQPLPHSAVQGGGGGGVLDLFIPSRESVCSFEAVRIRVNSCCGRIFPSELPVISMFVFLKGL